MSTKPVSSIPDPSSLGEKFLYELKAGPAGGRLRRPSSAGGTIGLDHHGESCALREVELLARASCDGRHDLVPITLTTTSAMPVLSPKLRCDRSGA